MADDGAVSLDPTARTAPPVTILWRDPQVAIVDKPAGVAVHRGWAADGPFMVQLVRDALGQRVWPAHRLDRPTSGALLMALDPDTAAALARRFRARDVHKRYLALVRGHPPDEGAIDHPLARERGAERRPARTDYHRIWTWERRYSLVEARPRTGRSHQIRRHLKHIGHPLIGDVRYGKGPHNRYFRAEYGLHRLALHALELGLEHPHTGARLTVVAPLPPPFAETLTAMGMPAELLARVQRPSDGVGA